VSCRRSTIKDYIKENFYRETRDVLPESRNNGMDGFKTTPRNSRNKNMVKRKKNKMVGWR
jgi:hypothetical protein